LDSLVISSDQHNVETFTAADSLNDVTEQTVPSELMKGLSGEAGGSPSGGDYTSDLSGLASCSHLIMQGLRLSHEALAARYYFRKVDFFIEVSTD
tara:strand:- start:2408 stop:2692 length:285 start_codon:yes stop_codon:yes gene_type:complete